MWLGGCFALIIVKLESDLHNILGTAGDYVIKLIFKILAISMRVSTIMSVEK